MQSDDVHSADMAREDTREPARQGHPLRVWLARSLVLVAVLLSAALLYRTLSQYDFSELVDSVRAIPSWRLVAAAGWAAASYLCLSLNDWLALFYARKPLPYRTAALTSFVALSFGHNIGFAALSSGAIRYRFYSRLGLGAEEVTKIIVFCGTTIFLGMFILGDIALFVRPDLAQAMTGMSQSAITMLGAALALVPLGYLVLATVLRQRLRLFGWSFEMPSLRLALAQMAVGSVNFIFVAACLHTAVSAVAEVSYFEVLFAFVLANTATIITHTPGGLGVIETVVLFLLHRPDLIGAVLVFRFVYFLLPLCLGGAVFAIAEAAFRRSAWRSETTTRSGRDARSPRGKQRGEAHGTARVEQPRPEYQAGRALP